LLGAKEHREKERSGDGKYQTDCASFHPCLLSMTRTIGWDEFH
jgi:hypothetical protein